MLIFRQKRILWDYGNDHVTIMYPTTLHRFNQLKSELYLRYGNDYGLTEVKQVLSQLK